MIESAITPIEWESVFFGKKIARLQLDGPLPSKQAIEEYSYKNGIDLLQACVDTSDNDTIFALENLGFHFVDLRLFMAADINKMTRHIPKNEHIHISQENDIPKLLSVSHHSFTPFSRYNWQSFFTIQQIDAFYNTWLENGVRGKHDDFCFHYQIGDQIVGLTTIKVQNNFAYIGIIAVDSAFRGRSIGNSLVANVFNYALEHDLAGVSSATQGKNATTQNLYAKHGMRITEMQSWYYKKTEGKL